MNTDQNKINCSIDLIEVLHLENLIFPNDFDTNSYLTHIWSCGQKLWKNVELTSYSNHDISHHSMKILEYFLDLEKIINPGWSDYEKLIFATATIIHDIGMQYNKWAGNLIGMIDSFPEPSISFDDVRAKHCDFAYNLIDYQIDHQKDYKIKYPQSFLGSINFQAATALGRSNIIAASHSTNNSEKYRQMLIDQSGNFEEKITLEFLYRPRLLAGYLRLCDEFDCSISRIDHPDRIFNKDLDPVSKKHWMSCMFVESLEIEVDKHNLANININWQVPINSDPDTITKIKSFLNEIRITKIISEINAVNEFFADCNETHHIKQIHVNPLKDEPGTFYFDFDTDLIKVLDEAIKS